MCSWYLFYQTQSAPSPFASTVRPFTVASPDAQVRTGWILFAVVARDRRVAALSCVWHRGRLDEITMTKERGEWWGKRRLRNIENRKKDIKRNHHHRQREWKKEIESSFQQGVGFSLCKNKRSGSYIDRWSLSPNFTLLLPPKGHIYTHTIGGL